VPNNQDFSELKNIKTIKISPLGWTNPITIEYGIGYPEYHEGPFYYWRIEGTEHTFIIPVSRLDFLSSGDYGIHFTEALCCFRADYLEWKKKNFSAPWMREYKSQFSRFIQD